MDAQERLRQAERFRRAGERARRTAVRGRIVRTGVLVAALMLLGGVLDTWVTARWLWWLCYFVGVYLVLRGVARAEEWLPARAGRTPRADLTVGAATLVAVAALYPVLPHGLAAYGISAVVAVVVAVAGAWWFTR